MTEVTGRLMGYNKSWVWFRVPQRPDATRDFVILTLPRATLKRGYATAEDISMKVRYPVRHNGHGFVADVELLSVISKKGLDPDQVGSST